MGKDSVMIGGYDIVEYPDNVLDEFDRVIGLDRLRDLPFLLETPNELGGYAREISMLKGLRK